MTQPCSEDLRERSLARYAASDTIRKWRTLKRETGGLAPGRQIGGHKKPVPSSALSAWLAERVRNGPFTLR